MGTPRRFGWSPTRGESKSAPSLDRRRFLVLAGASAAYLALRPQLALARKVAIALPPIQPWALPADPPGNPIDLARALIGAAVLAPSHWNTQPWRFEVEGSAIRIVMDPQRALPMVDPDQRAMMVSLGAALENLLITARAYGLRPVVTYFPFKGARGVVADVSWTVGDLRRDQALFAAIPARRTNRRTYDGRGVLGQSRAQLSAQVPEELRLHWLDDRDPKRVVSDLAYEAVHAQVADRRMEKERFHWMRFGDDDARRRGDGITIDALELGGPARWIAGRYFAPKSRFLRFGAGSAAKQARESIRSSGALALLCSTGRSEAEWLTGGQAFERVALKATQLGLALQPIQEPIAVEKMRGELLHRFGAAGEHPLLLVRIGHAKRCAPSVRRGVASVASFRNS
jgi:nitroreductase